MRTPAEEGNAAARRDAEPLEAKADRLMGEWYEVMLDMREIRQETRRVIEEAAKSGNPSVRYWASKLASELDPSADGTEGVVQALVQLRDKIQEGA